MILAIELISIIAPVFLIGFIGYVWAATGQAFDSAFVARMVGLVGTPCLVFTALAEADIGLAALQSIAFAMIICVAVFVVLGTATLKVTGLPVNVHLPALITPNVGNMGLPICLFAFGADGLVLAVAVMATLTITCFSLNIWIASGTASPLEALKQPAIWASVLGALVIYFDLQMPKWLLDTTRIVGGLSIPLMLLALGVSIATLKIADVRRSAFLSIWRLGVGYVVALGVASLLDLDPLVRNVLILQASMPAAVFTFLFAQMYDTRPSEVAGTIVLSTLFSLITLPVILLTLL